MVRCASPAVCSITTPLCLADRPIGHRVGWWAVRALVQRVSGACVDVVADDGKRTEVGRIGPGLCVLVGVTHTDSEAHATKLAVKIWNLRVMADDHGVMNRSVADTTKAVLVVSQFTLYADARKGRRPSFDGAAPAETARRLFEEFVARLRASGLMIHVGVFQEHMQVESVNNGPVTILLDSPTGGIVSGSSEHGHGSETPQG